MAQRIVTSSGGWVQSYEDWKKKSKPASGEKPAPTTEPTWRNRGLFADGRQRGDVTRTALATVDDASEDFLAGILGMGEAAVDAAAWLAPALRQYNPEFRFDIDQYREDSRNAAAFIQKDLYDEDAAARNALVGLKAGGNAAQILKSGGQLTQADLDLIAPTKAAVRDYMDNHMEAESILGSKADGLVRSGGQLAGQAALSAAGLPWWVTSGLTSFGGEAENALNQGATFEQAGASGLVSAAAETLFETISGGIQFGGKTADDALTALISREVSNKTLRTLSKLGLDVVGEGTEEVLSGLMGAIGQKLTYASEKELNQLFSSEDAWDAFVGGAFLGGTAGSAKAIRANGTGIDYVSGLTGNEQKVAFFEYSRRAAEAEKKGKVSNSQKARIYDQVLRDMEKGAISTDIIEEVLGGETYKAYKAALEAQEDNDFLTEYNNLGGREGATPRDALRYFEMAPRAKAIDAKRQDLKQRLGREVSDLVRSDRLYESYNENTRRGQNFQADLSRYDAAQRRIVQKAIDSGVLNNTNRTHDFVDLVAKIAADKGLDFDFADSRKIREAGFGVDGFHVVGYVNGNVVTVNMQSAGALNTVVGHEIAHVLEGTELYDSLQKAAFDYARSKGELPARWRSVKNRYQNLDNTAVNQELTADLVGDYVFSDTDFVKSLYAGDRTVFEKVYDEVQYLSRVVSAGSKEGRQLEKVKKAFADAYREGGTNTASSEVRYKIYNRPDFTKDEWSIVNRRKHSEFDNPKYDLDADKKFLYANEKGSTVFAIYSKHDVDDPTVLYGSRGRNAERDCARVSAFIEEGGKNVKQSGRTLDRLLATIERGEVGRGSSAASSAGGASATGNVPIYLEEQGRNRRRAFIDGREDLGKENLSKESNEASDQPGASSLTTFSNDYETIRRFLKE